MDIIFLTCVSGAVFQRSLGAYQLSHFCQSNGFTSQVIDFVNDFTQDELTSVLDKFCNDKTLCIGISTSFFNDFKIMVDNQSSLPLHIPEHISNACTYIKEKYPKIRICLGGAKSLYGVNILWVDDIFHGYSEDQFLQYCKELKENRVNPFVKKINNKNVYDKENTKFDIKTLNHKFSKHDCILPKEVLPIEISRGCIFKCKFCAFPLNGKKKFDYIRDFQLLKDEFIYNYENFGTTQYFFNDDTLNDSTYKIENLHKIIKSLPFNVEFSSWMRVDLLYKNKETINLLKDMGLKTTFFGIESFNNQSLKSIGKSTDANKIKTFLEELYYTHWNQEISIMLGMIVGLPFESVNSIQDSVKWLSSRPFSFHFEPLRLSDSGGTFYKSEFETNYSKYNYKIGNNLEWYNEYMTQAVAQELATSINSTFAYKNNTLAGSYLFALLNHFEYNQIKNAKIIDINYKDIIKTRKVLIKKYKNLLNSLS